MVPGAIGGQYALHEAQIDVARLAARADGAFVAASAVGVDAKRHVLMLSDGRQLAYDLLSFDIGAQAKRPPAASDSVRIIALKPIENAIAALDAALAAPNADAARVVVAGAGAGGSEVAMALAARMQRARRGAVVVCDEAARPVLERGARTATLVERAFDAAGISFVGGSAV
jgi:NADH dehydrogenase FAD-containing subunit